MKWVKTVTIESDGTPTGTRVYDADTGEWIPNILKLHLEIESGELTTGLMVLDLGEEEEMVPIEVEEW